MKDYKKSITVPGGGVNALEDRVFQSTVITDINYDNNDNAVIFNVGSKMAITFSSTDVRVGIGQALIDGCIFDNEVISIITPDRPTSGTAKAYICMTIDLNGTTGQKQYYEDVLGDAANFPTLVQDSLVEMVGGMKQIPIASFVIDSNGFITEDVDLTAALLHTTKEPVYSVDGVLPDEAGDISLTDRYLSKSGGEVTGPLIIPSGTNIRGTSSEISVIEMMRNDNTIRTGFVGKGSAEGTHFAVHSDEGDVVLEPASGSKARVGANEILTTASKIQTVFSLDELGLDGSWTYNDSAENIKMAYDEIVSRIGNDSPFMIVQGLYNAEDDTNNHTAFIESIHDDILAQYGSTLQTTTFEIRIVFGTFAGYTSAYHNTTNFIEIRSSYDYWYKKADYDNWANELWTDEEGYIVNPNNGTQLTSASVSSSADSVSFLENAWLYDHIVFHSSSPSYVDVQIELNTRQSSDSTLTGMCMRATVGGTNPTWQIHTVGGMLSGDGRTLTKASDVSSIGGYVNIVHASSPTTSESGVTYTVWGYGKRRSPNNDITFRKIPQLETPNISPEAGTND